MSRRSPLCRLLFVALVIAAASQAAAAETPVRSYRLAIEVAYGEPVGPQSVIDELTARIVPRMRELACFGDAQPAGDEAHEADLLLRVRLDEYSEEILYEVPLAARAQAIDPEVRRRLVARFRVRARVELLTLPDLRSVRRGGRRIGTAVRPLMPGHEDDYARREARLRAVDEIVDLAAAKACRGSVRKLQRQIESAGGAS